MGRLPAGDAKKIIGSTRNHQRALTATMGSLQYAFGQKIYITKQVCGLFQRVSPSATPERVHVGIRGQADLGGWVLHRTHILAIPFQIEIKTGKGSQSGDQKSFEYMCMRTGCPYILARFETEGDLGPSSMVIHNVIEKLKEFSGHV